MRKPDALLDILTRRKLWLVALSALPFFGGIAAFGTDPDTLPNEIQTETVIESIDLPEPVAIDSGNFDFWREERVQRGDSLASLLNRLGVSEEEIPRIIAAGRETTGLSRLTAGRSVLAQVTSSGRLLLYRYMVDNDRLISVERVGGEFRVKEEPVRLDTRMVLRSGEIRSSLFGATDAAGIPDSIASQIADIFSGDIDFHRDLRRGDRFSVVYEAFYHNGATVKTGRILAAEFVNQGKPHRAVYFQDPQGRDGYYTPDGQSMKRAFLKSPIPFSRISSGFSSARLHPVLNTWRAHKGIDYAAPTGTPIRAVADATVSFAGRQGAYGNLVTLEHHRPYSTAYAHMSGFANGIRKGARVRQGEIIGYVGSTGLATGPHLHYEFRVNGEQKNPLALNLPTSIPLDNRYRAQFTASSGPLVAKLDLVNGRSFAALE